MFVAQPRSDEIVATVSAMREPFAHQVVVEMDTRGDVRALGGAVSKAVCGAWDHPGPCPLAPHHTAVSQEGERITVRVLFATEPENEARVRQLITEALQGGGIVDPEGEAQAWRYVEGGPSGIANNEVMQAFQLVSSPR